MEIKNCKINKNCIETYFDIENIIKFEINKYSTNILPVDNIVNYNSKLLSFLKNYSYLPIYLSQTECKIYSNVNFPKVITDIFKSRFNLEYNYNISFNFEEAKKAKFIIINEKSHKIIRHEYNLINFNSIIIYVGKILPNDLGYLKEKGKLFFINEKYSLCRPLFNILIECIEFNYEKNEINTNDFEDINFIDTFKIFNSHSNEIKDQFTKYSIIQKLKNLNPNSFIELLEEITILSSNQNLVTILSAIISDKEYELKVFFGTFYFLKRIKYSFNNNINVSFISELMGNVDKNGETLYYNTIYSNKNRLLYFSIISIASCLKDDMNKYITKIELDINSYIKPDVASCLFGYLDININSYDKNTICKISPILYHCLAIRDKINPFDKNIEVDSLIKKEGQEILCDIFYIILYNIYLKDIRNLSVQTKINLSLHISKWLISNKFYHINSFEKAVILFFIESLPKSNIKYLIIQVIMKSKVDNNIVSYYYDLFKSYPTF